MNLNNVTLGGRLTRDPEVKTFASGGKVAKFGFVLSRRRKAGGQWEEYPMFIDCEAFNRGETGKLADLVEKYLQKGNRVVIEGELDLETWDDKTTGAKRSKHKLVVNRVHFVEKKEDVEGGGKSEKSGDRRQRQHEETQGGEGGDFTQDGDEIPF